MKIEALDYSNNPQALRHALGGLVGIDWLQMMIARGYGWYAKLGGLSTGVTGGGAGTVLDVDEPELAFNVPRGYVCVPLRIAVQINPIETSTTDLDESEILICADQGSQGGRAGFVDPTSGATPFQPLNMRSDIGTGCPLTCFHTVTTALVRDEGVTAGSNPPVENMELARWSNKWDNQSAVGIVQATDNLVYEPKNPEFLVGPSALFVHFGGTVALTGFIQAKVLAFPADLLPLKA